MQMTELDSNNSALEANVFDHGLQGFRAIDETILNFKDELENLAVFADEKTGKKVAKLIHQTETLEPSITFIGQIKAGKTSLINAMIGSPEFLPADVNPWTSVVTSVHLNAHRSDQSSKARFQFFNEAEWDQLVSDGGRIGKLAARVGADDEVDKLNAQIAEMREKTRKSLGRKFELLLGQEHNYGYVDDDLIQRYVCKGDDDEDDDSPDQQGRFVDITKSADLFLSRPVIPVALTLRDTPGVNDTFMMREQITINAIRDSRICVVVLSAHQALTTMDMAMIRLIANLKSREILIFVNRIDELPDPAAQIPEIHQSIIDAMRKNNAPTNVDIVYGSAQWANDALLNQIDNMHEDSIAALANWSKSKFSKESETLDKSELAWLASGIPSLFEALSTRIQEGSFKDLTQKIARSAINIGRGLEATKHVIISETDGSTARKIDPETLSADLDRVEHDLVERMKKSTEDISNNFIARIDQSYERFLERATASLIDHLERNGEDAVWEYSPMGLRLLLSSSYQVALNKMKSLSGEVNAAAADMITDLYIKLYDVKIEGFKIEPVAVPHIPPPVGIGQTIALDIQSGWWKGWWQRRKGYQAFAKDFQELIRTETDPIINDLKTTQVGLFQDATMAALTGFLADQRGILMDVSRRSEMEREDLDVLFGAVERDLRQEGLELTIEELGYYAE